MENYLNFMWPFGSMNSNVSMGGIDQTNASNNMKANTNYPAITGLPHSGFEEMDRMSKKGLIGYMGQKKEDEIGQWAKTLLEYLK